MMFATAATQLLARTTRMLDSRHAVHMNRRAYVRAVVPIGVLYSASMVCSTLVYLYLSVPFIQMLKVRRRGREKIAYSTKSSRSYPTKSSAD